jgi:hypothetical protein
MKGQMRRENDVPKNGDARVLKLKSLRKAIDMTGEIMTQTCQWMRKQKSACGCWRRASAHKMKPHGKAV